LRVLGLDPGSSHTGWGVVEFVGGSMAARAWGRLSPKSSGSLADRLREISEGLDRLLAEHRPDLVALERVFHGRNSRSLIVLAEARGALLVAIARRGTPLAEVAPAMVKSAVTGSGRSDKQQVSRMVRLQLGLGERTIAVDATDALAVAITGRQVWSAGARFER
jgi:crossover junction endodeoxyribonuclease RuvC